MKKAGPGRRTSQDYGEWPVEERRATPTRRRCRPGYCSVRPGHVIQHVADAGFYPDKAMTCWTSPPRADSGAGALGRVTNRAFLTTGTVDESPGYVGGVRACFFGPFGRSEQRMAPPGHPEPRVSPGMIRRLADVLASSAPQYTKMVRLTRPDLAGHENWRAPDTMPTTSVRADPYDPLGTVGLHPALLRRGHNVTWI